MALFFFLPLRPAVIVETAEMLLVICHTLSKVRVQAGVSSQLYK